MIKVANLAVLVLAKDTKSFITVFNGTLCLRLTT